MSDVAVYQELVKDSRRKHEPDMKDGLVHAWRAAKRAVSKKSLRDAITAENWDKLAKALMRGKPEQRTAEVMEPRLAGSYLRGVELGARPLSRIHARVRAGGPKFTFDFARMNPHAAAWAKRRSGRLILAPADVKRLVRQFVTDAVEDGFTVDETAELISGIVGLDERRAMALETYAEELRASNVASTTLLDRVAAYARELIDARAETIARTEILMATNAGQQGAWEEAVKEALIDPDVMKRVWLLTDDEKLCEGCSALAAESEEEPVGIDEPFEGDVMFPPLHPNCRCSIGLVAHHEKFYAASRVGYERQTLEMSAQSLDAIQQLSQAMLQKKTLHVVRDSHGRIVSAEYVTVSGL